jgi:hypothetical protein
MEKSVKENNNGKLNDVARSFIEIALQAMTKATWVQTNGYENTDSDLVKRIMEVTQSVGDLSREK